MNLFIVILLMNCLHLFGEKLYKKQLRGLYEENLSRILTEEFTLTFNGIKNNIIERAMTGENTYRFTIMCTQRHIPQQTCDYYDGHKEWLKSHPDSVLSISKTYTTREQITTSIIGLVPDMFPDVNISKSYNNCCDIYQIEW
jgi:hypothetical protein